MSTPTSPDGRSPLPLFREVLGTLCTEGGETWAPGIRAIVQALSRPCANEQDERETINEAKRRFEGLLGGKGGLSEFYIARPSFAEQVSANNAFEALKARILTA